MTPKYSNQCCQRLILWNQRHRRAGIQAISIATITTAAPPCIRRRRRSIAAASSSAANVASNASPSPPVVASSRRAAVAAAADDDDSPASPLVIVVAAAATSASHRLWWSSSIAAKARNEPHAMAKGTWISGRCVSCWVSWIGGRDGSGSSRGQASECRHLSHRDHASMQRRNGSNHTAAQHVPPSHRRRAGPPYRSPPRRSPPGDGHARGRRRRRGPRCEANQ